MGIEFQQNDLKFKYYFSVDIALSSKYCNPNILPSQRYCIYVVNDMNPDLRYCSSTNSLVHFPYKGNALMLKMK
jgi:hypothetical protein